MKYLLVLIVVGVGIWILSARFRKSRETGADPSEAGRTRKGAGPQDRPARMVVCAHCGVHLPAAEAVFAGETPFCTDAHRQAGPR